ncbi:MAG: hypothetical protein IPL61_24935 [Myxococcales bacterium]|nr:hypothetical protein [Myxococcales bacterium]
MKLGLLLASVLLACASTNDTSIDATEADAARGDGPTAPDAAVAADCPAGLVATSISPTGELGCAAVDDAAAVAVRSRCSVYLGQRDSCTGCADPPAKWTMSGPLACAPGVGAGNTCLTATLDDPTTPVELAALDLDGDVNGDDKLYTTLHCVAVPRAPVPAPCQQGWAITGRSGTSWTCAPLAEAVVGYVRSQCSIYLGWQDSCDGCTTPPSKWGHANDAGCTSGAGANGTCTTTILGGETVNLFGLNTGGDVDGNDKLHLGLTCTPPTAPGEASRTQCPDGQFVVGTNADGSFDCADPAAAFAAYVDTHCALFLGWRDSCDGCTQAPTKWGKTGTSACTPGVGADDTCTAMTLGGTTVQMFGLNTDGDVNSDDTLYLGLRCTP